MSDQVTPLKKEGNREHGVEPLIQVRDIEVVYNSIILAVRGVTIDLNRGQTVALLGPNGAGKTTTLKAVSRLITQKVEQFRKAKSSMKERRLTRGTRTKR